MAQFDAYVNPNAAQREAFPYLVVLQSDQLDHYSTRFVMPLVRLPRPPADAPRRLAQTVRVGGEPCHLAAHLCAALPAKLLRKPVASLRGEAGVFRDALDAVVSGV
ncbi:MAG: CcdB family protein [Ramlibacter sp.]|nr:CcdB family protein [Ramlibacter sp.]